MKALDRVSKNADFLEEVTKGKIKAFSILAEPQTAEVIWKAAKETECCTPIIVTDCRWEEENIAREAKKKMEEEERLKAEERRTEREEKMKKENEKKERKEALQRTITRVKRQMKNTGWLQP